MDNLCISALGGGVGGGSEYSPLRTYYLKILYFDCTDNKIKINRMIF